MRHESHDKETYTHGHDASVLQVHRRRTAIDSTAYLLPFLAPGMTLLDVGCGPGSITLDLAERVAPGQVTGLDAAAAAVEEAHRAARDRGDDTTRLVVGDVYATDFPAAAFDVVHAHQVLQHLGDPVAALREMGRVVRPGGLLAVRDADYATFTWYPAAAGLARWLELYHQVARHAGAEPDAGRRLVAWAHAAGLTDLAVSTSTWSYHAPEQRHRLAEGWAERLTSSALADNALEFGLSTRDELASIADAWRAWAADPDGWFVMVHGEVIARIPG